MLIERTTRASRRLRSETAFFQIHNMLQRLYFFLESKTIDLEQICFKKIYFSEIYLKIKIKNI